MSNNAKYKSLSRLKKNAITKNKLLTLDVIHVSLDLQQDQQHHL